MSSLRAQLEVQTAKTRNGENDTVKEAAKRDVADLQARLVQAQRDFDAVATGVNVAELERLPSTGKFDLGLEMNDLLEPLVHELKSVTEQPRVIEKLRGDLAYQIKRQALVEQAVKNMDAILKQTPKGKDAASPEADLRKALQATVDKWRNTLSENKAGVEVTQYQLDKTLARRKSIWDIVTQAVQSFFLSRGRNMVLTCLTFALAFLCWRALHRWLVKYSPWHRSQHDRPFIARALDVAYHAFAFVIATVAALTVLYSTGDWLLLGLSLIMLLGLLLAAKNGLPKYYRQARLLLNLGEVREGERIVINGLSWQVKSINMFTHLHNPSMRNGGLRMPLSQLAGMSSRPHSPGEPWFPCTEGDWILLNDGTFGKAVCLTPEYVQVVQLGGAHKTYPTLRFLSENPVNFAGGFRVSSVLRLDHQHRADAMSVIPEALQTTVHAGLLTLVEPTELRSLKVELKASTPVALEIEIIADYHGKVAEKYPTLQRAIQKYALETCIAKGWKLATQTELRLP